MTAIIARTCRRQALRFLFIIVASRSVQGSSQLADMTGQHWIIAAKGFNSYLYLYTDENSGNITRADGIMHQMFIWMADKHHLTFDYVKPPDGYFGALVNGSWNGMVGMAARREVDLIGMQLTVTHARSLVIDFTTSFSRDPMSAIIPAPVQQSYMAAVVAPFTPPVWVLIFASMIGSILITWWMVNAIHKYLPERFGTCPRSLLEAGTNLQFYIRIILGQSGHNMPPMTVSIRMPIILWCLMCVIFLNVYSAGLQSFIAVPKWTTLIDSLEDLANTNKLQLALLKDSAFESIILEAKSGKYKILGDSLRNHPANRLSGDYWEPELFLQLALTEKFAMVDQVSYLESVLDLAYKNASLCLLTMMKEQIVTSLDSFAIQKGSPLREPVDRAILTMIAFGLVDYWERRYLIKPICENRKTFGNQSKKPRQTLSQLLGPMLILLVGLGSSLVAFLFEGALVRKVNWKELFLRLGGQRPSKKIIEL